MLKQIYCFLCACLIGINPMLASETHESGYVIPLSDDQFEDFIQKSDKPVIIDFWASSCPPCLHMKPIIEELANEYKEKYIFVSMDIEKDQRIAIQHGVMRLPTFTVIKNNTVIGTLVGYIDKQTFIEYVENVVLEKSL